MHLPLHFTQLYAQWLPSAFGLICISCLLQAEHNLVHCLKFIIPVSFDVLIYFVCQHLISFKSFKELSKDHGSLVSKDFCNELGC